MKEIISIKPHHFIDIMTSLGAGKILGFSVLPASYQPMLVAILAPGAFIVMGLLMGLLNLSKKKRR